jgi:hypothetical protein
MTKSDVLSALHDGHLMSLSVEDPNGVQLGCRSLSGTTVTIRLCDVVDFCANNFRKGNIILSADVYGTSDRLEDDAIRALAQSDRPEHLKAYKERLRNNDTAGGFQYFVLQSSYGCDLVAVCRGAIDADA